MRFFGSSAIILALGATAVAGHVIHSTHDHGHHEPAVSYSIFELHDEPHHHAEHHDGHYDHHEHKDDHVAVYEHHKDHDEHHKSEHDDKHNSHPKYDFKYGVKDPKTGDVKEQWESRDGDKVKGGYSLKDADGTTRIVHYQSDKKKGFEAIVHKIGEAKEEHKEHEHQAHHGHVAQHSHGWSR